MNKHYSIFDLSTLLIKGTVMCDDSLIYKHIGENEGYIEGEKDRFKYKVSETLDSFVELSGDEINDLAFEERKNRIPPGLNVSLSDADLDSCIDQYFLGKIDVQAWRIKNYELLRKLSYSSLSDRADAAVKIKRGTKTGNAELVAEGEAQIDAMDDHDWAVKERFPKE